MAQILDLTNHLNLKYAVGDQPNFLDFSVEMDQKFTIDQKITDLDFYLNQILSSESSVSFTQHVREFFRFDMAMKE